MARYWVDQFSYVTGVVRYKDLMYFSLVSDEVAQKRISQSLFFEWDAGSWRGGEETSRSWDTVGATIALQPLEQAIFLGEKRQVTCIGSGDIHDEQIGSNENTPADRGPMRGIRTIGNQVYAVGMNRQAYRRNTSGQWSCIDDGARPPVETEEIVGFEAIDGFNENDVYVVGWEGEIWQYDGTTWSRKVSPTNLVLVDVCCAGDGIVYACSRIGTLVCGRGDKWETIDHTTFTDDIWNIAWYKDKLYLATMDSIYTYADHSIKNVDLGNDHPDTCFHLSVRDGVLCSIGAKDVMIFDGKTWSRID